MELDHGASVYRENLVYLVHLFAWLLIMISMETLEYRPIIQHAIHHQRHPSVLAQSPPTKDQSFPCKSQKKEMDLSTVLGPDARNLHRT